MNMASSKGTSAVQLSGRSPSYEICVGIPELGFVKWTLNDGLPLDSVDDIPATNLPEYGAGGALGSLHMVLN